MSLCKKEFKYYGNTTNMKKHSKNASSTVERKSAGLSSSTDYEENFEVPITETSSQGYEKLLTLQERCSKRKLDIDSVCERKPPKLFGVRNTISDAKKLEINSK